MRAAAADCTKGRNGGVMVHAMVISGKNSVVCEIIERWVKNKLVSSLSDCKKVLFVFEPEPLGAGKKDLELMFAKNKKVAQKLHNSDIG